MKLVNLVGRITLIKLMLMVAVLGVLATLAYSAYQNQIIEVHRTVAKTALTEIMHAQKRFFKDNGTYTTNLTGVAPSGLGYADAGGGVFATPGNYYKVTATACGAGIVQCVRLTAIAATVQRRDGNLTLDSQGVKTPASMW